MGYVPYRRGLLLAILFGVVALLIGPAAAPAATLNGGALALRSSGVAAGTGWTLTSDGYVGTYVTLSQPATVSVSTLATGTADSGVAPRLTYVVANSRQSFSVSSTTSTYTYTTPSLAAGTYIVRAQLDNQTGSAAPTLTISNLTITGTGVTVLNDNSDANALAAAKTYATNYRSGAATVTLVDQRGHPLGGTAAHVQLTRNAFNFAVAVSGEFPDDALWLDYNHTTGEYIPPAPGSPEATYQQHLVQNFNTVVPANAGKWVNEERIQGQTTMQLTDAITQFAVTKGLAIRMHNLIWHFQQPDWLTPAFLNNDAAFVNAAITNRIGYYVNQRNVPLGTPRGSNYMEMDVLNEPVHDMATGNTDQYHTLLGPAGVANVYKQVQAATASIGGNTRLYTNEWNVLSSSTDPSTGVADPYANWYLREIELLNNAGSGHVVTGTGTECYVFYLFDAPQLSPATMTEAMQNLSVAGNPLTLSEFGVSQVTPVTPSPATVGADLKTALTMTYGNPDATTFGFWGGLGGVDYLGPSSLYDPAWNITPVGQAYQQWQAQYQTDLSLTTNKKGQLSFTGTYGTYRLTVNGMDYTFKIEPGAASATVTVRP